jgi:hypothetical protein
MEDNNEVGNQQRKDAEAIKACAMISQEVHEAIKGLPDYIRYGDKALNTQADIEANIVFNDCARDFAQSQPLPPAQNKDAKGR